MNHKVFFMNHKWVETNRLLKWTHFRLKIIFRTLISKPKGYKHGCFNHKFCNNDGGILINKIENLFKKCCVQKSHVLTFLLRRDFPLNDNINIIIYAVLFQNVVRQVENLYFTMLHHFIPTTTYLHA